MITVTWKEMHGEGEFNCPKCGISISPEHDEDWEDISGEQVEFPESPSLVLLVIKHACGQKIKIDMTGFKEEGEKYADE